MGTIWEILAIGATVHDYWPCFSGGGFQYDRTTLTADDGIKTEAFQRIHDQGRAKHVGVVIDKYVSFII